MHYGPWYHLEPAQLRSFRCLFACPVHFLFMALAVMLLVVRIMGEFRNRSPTKNSFEGGFFWCSGLKLNFEIRTTLEELMSIRCSAAYIALAYYTRFCLASFPTSYPDDCRVIMDLTGFKDNVIVIMPSESVVPTVLKRKGSLGDFNRYNNQFSFRMRKCGVAYRFLRCIYRRPWQSSGFGEST